MPLTRHVLLAFAIAYTINAAADNKFNNMDIYKGVHWDDPANYEGVDFTNKDLYAGVDFTGGKSQTNGVDQTEHAGNTHAGTSPPVQGKNVVPDDEPREPDSSSSISTPPVPSPSGGTDYTGSDTKGSDTKGSDTKSSGNRDEDSASEHTTGDDSTSGGHGGGSGDHSGGGSGQACPDSCKMSVTFTKGSDAVDFAVKPASEQWMAGKPAIAKPLKGTTRDSCVCIESGNPRISIGTSDHNQHTTLVEANFEDDGWFDVSFVEGFSVPVVCWVDEGSGRKMSGYNKDLFKNGHDCAKVEKIKQSTGKTIQNCVNPGYEILMKPGNECWQCTNPSAFFAPAAGAAYTYPKDDATCASNPEAKGNYASPMATGMKIECCVGENCPENTFSTGGMTSWGNCEGPCVPCGGNSGVDPNGQPTCAAGDKKPQSCRGKRDLGGVFAGIEEKRKTRKRHAHRQHHAAHGSV